MPRKSALERFTEKYIVQPSGCWEWTAGLDKDGYGQFKYLGRTWGAHRAGYFMLVGETELALDHLCRNRRCVNPEHLEPVVTGENTLRGESFSAVNARKTHCDKGHEFAGENLILKKTAKGYQRYCRACRNERERIRMKNNYKPKVA